jgi:Glycosyl transferase family 11
MNPANTCITVRLQGGLGNQLFQIAAGYALAKRLRVPFYLVNFQFDGMGQGSHPSKYYDTIFQKLQFVDGLENMVELSQIGWKAGEQSLDQEAATILNSGFSGIILKGYFQGQAFFQESIEDVRQLFTPSEGIVGWLIANTVVFNKFPELRTDHGFGLIGVRRGDYLKNPGVHWPCGMAYYTEAMKRMGCERYYIATDDIHWVRANFKGDQFRFLDIADDLELLYTMTLFRNYIIGNSTYHWWGTFLSIYPTPRIIAPDKWINIYGYDGIYTPSMEVLERPVEIA